MRVWTAQNAGERSSGRSGAAAVCWCFQLLRCCRGGEVQWCPGVAIWNRDTEFTWPHRAHALFGKHRWWYRQD